MIFARKIPRHDLSHRGFPIVSYFLGVVLLKDASFQKNVTVPWGSFPSVRSQEISAQRQYLCKAGWMECFRYLNHLTTSVYRDKNLYSTGNWVRIWLKRCTNPVNQKICGTITLNKKQGGKSLSVILPPCFTWTSLRLTWYILSYFKLTYYPKSCSISVQIGFNIYISHSF